MRAIKFRAWDDKNKKWLLGYDYPNLGGFNLIGECVLFGEWGNVSQTFLFNQDDKTLEDLKIMQFTGDTDKNDKEIYEGDIVNYTRSIGNWTGQFMTTTHEIIFSEEIFAFVMKDRCGYIKLRKHWGYEYEVIGNIYESPELLINKL